MIDIQEKEEKIIEFLKTHGPSLPVRIAKAIEMDPMFASAIASELITSKQITTSNLKIGASFLYLIPGQENQLENFVENLKPAEQNAYEKIKKEKVIIDEDEEPVIRVALRNIKDFASPFKYQEKIMWKYIFTPEEEIKKLLNNTNKNLQKGLEEEQSQEEENIEEEEEILQEEEEEAGKEIIKEEEETTSLPEQEEVPKAWETKKEEIKELRKESIEPEKKVEDIFSIDEKNEPEPEFLIKTKEFLKTKNIEFLEEIRTEKKEVMAIVRITSQLGNINLLLISKDKKTTNKDEIRAAIQIATKNNMPCLMIIRKEPTKPVQKIIDENNLIKLEVME